MTYTTSSTNGSYTLVSQIHTPISTSYPNASVTTVYWGGEPLTYPGTNHIYIDDSYSFRNHENDKPQIDPDNLCDFLAAK